MGLTSNPHLADPAQCDSCAGSREGEGMGVLPIPSPSLLLPSPALGGGAACPWEFFPRRGGGNSTFHVALLVHCAGSWNSGGKIKRSSLVLHTSST